MLSLNSREGVTFWEKGDNVENRRKKGGKHNNTGPAGGGGKLVAQQKNRYYCKVSFLNPRQEGEGGGEKKGGLKLGRDMVVHGT